jgi:membrane-associated phospholipid phosphatase
MLNQLLAFSVEFIQSLQTQYEWLIPIMRLFTFLGNEEFYLIVMPVFLWAVDYSAGIRLGIIMLLSGSLNTIFKFIFHQPRPYWVDSNVINLDQPHNSFGLPSGHSQNAASLFGMLAAWFHQKWLSVAMIFIIFMVAISRLFLGVHSIQDIILGLFLGGLLLWIFLKFGDKISELFASVSIPVRIAITLGVSLFLLFTAVGIAELQNEFIIPDNWDMNAELAQHEEPLSPFDIDGMITSTAAFFGVVLGSIWIQETGGFNANQGTWWKRALRFLIGLIGVLLFWKVLGDIFPRNEDFISYALRYFRYTLVGLWISGLAPWLFIRLDLGTKNLSKCL